MILLKRPIKFRARCIDGEIIHGDLCHCGKEVGIRCKKDDQFGVYEVDPETVAQFVGYDKDGNELYEGDPVRDETGEGWVSLLGRAGLQFKEIGATFDSQTLAKDDDVLFVRK